MNDLERDVLCGSCPKAKLHINKSGTEFGVRYVILKSDKQYIIKDNPDTPWNELIKSKDRFISTYVPKFGKYEIEEFVGYKMMEALFISKDITDLLNSELVCNDFPYNITRISSERLKKELLKCFTKLEETDSVVKLMFMCKPYEEIE